MKLHELTGDRKYVLARMKETITHLSFDAPQTKDVAAKALGLPSEEDWPSVRDEIVDQLQRTYKREQNDSKFLMAKGPDEQPKTELWYAPRDQTVALFQSALDEYMEMTSSDSESKEAFVGEQFDVTDPRWIEVVVEKLKIKFKGKHKFITHKELDDFRLPLSETATIAIVGDWGGGNEAAQDIAAVIREKKPDHVIHLGDVYYAGTHKEVKERFLKYWQFWDSSGVPGRSLALNSNHEMYSGGYAYFDITLKEFQQPASYFSLSNQHWRFIGLDTGYVDHNLNKEQMEWFEAQLEGNQRNILLTHHQLFSDFEDTSDALKKWMEPYLQKEKIFGWFWGHEHLAIVYEKRMNVKARCLGNGCFPYDAPTEIPPGVEYINRRVQTDKPSHGMHSFALLTLEGAKMRIDYFDQDGTLGYSEDFGQ